MSCKFWNRHLTTECTRTPTPYVRYRMPVNPLALLKRERPLTGAGDSEADIRQEV